MKSTHTEGNAFTIVISREIQSDTQGFICEISGKTRNQNERLSSSTKEIIGIIFYPLEKQNQL